MTLPVKNRTESEIEKHQHAFEKDATPHLNNLYYMALHLTKNTTEAEDLVQDTLLRAYRFYDKYEQGTNFKAWLFTILRNLFINKFRKKKREPGKVNLEDIDFLLADEDNHAKTVRLITSRDDFSVSHYINDLDDEVFKVLKELPEDFVMPVILADVEDLPYKDIAEILDIPLGTVRSRIFRARAFIREKLKRYAEGMGYKKDDT